MTATVSRKVEKLLARSAVAAHAQDFVSSLHGLSACLAHTTGEGVVLTSSLARKSLRAALQRDSLRQCDELIDDFANVEQVGQT